MLTYFGKNSVLDVYHGSDYTSRKSLLLQIKSMYWFLYDRDLRLERVKYVSSWNGFTNKLNGAFEISRSDFLKVKIDSGIFVELNFCGCFIILIALVTT